jgi:hypothetical protein
MISNHEYATTEDTMDNINSTKSKHLEVLKTAHIHRAIKNKPILNEQYATDQNVLLDLIICRDKTKCINK